MTAEDSRLSRFKRERERGREGEGVSSTCVRKYGVDFPVTARRARQEQTTGVRDSTVRVRGGILDVAKGHGEMIWE